MMELAADAFLKLEVPMDNIHYERFDYGAGRGRIDKRRRFAALAILASLAAAGLAFSLRPA
jgi:ferredoxin-NADP reductase